MSLNTYPANPFPPSTNQMDADALETEVSQIKSGLTNYENQNNINLEVPDRKNVLPMTVEGIKAANTDGTWSGNTYTQNGISYTININNDGNIASIDISGTNTDNSQFNLTNRYIPNKYKDMILNGYNGGSKEEGEQNELYVAYSNNGTNWASDINCYDGDAALTKDYPYIFVTLVIRAQTNFSKTVYPMIRPAFIANSTFAPYIPSVESRIEAVESLFDSIFLPAIRLTAANDLNSVIKPGAYYFRDADNPANAPASNCYIAVIRQYDNSSRIAQIAYSFSVNTIYVRKTLDWGSTWGDWYSLDNTQVTQ